MNGYIVSRQLTKPLKRLAETAERFSTDLQSEALSLNGPKEVREAAESFNLMQSRIQRFLEERMQLIAAISHDLRTPLTRLQLRVDNISDEQQRRKALDDIQEMKNMVQSTLAFIRDDTASEVMVKTDIVSLLRTICDDISDTTGPAEYHGPNKCIISCKPDALKRALTNLLENAVKYGSKASVLLTINDGQVEINITDNGPGIPVEESENVFLPFYRVEKSRNRETGGVGLGLSISRTIIRSHGGDIILQNVYGGGLCAVVTLPLVQP